MSPDERVLIERFGRAAASFCSYVESAPAPSTATYRELARFLADLCALALQLPHVERSDRTPRTSTPSELTIGFGNRDCYREVFDPYPDDDDDDAVIGSLTDDMRDIHRELANGLVLFRNGSDSDLQDAAWDWRFSFNVHWGEHATSALRALYWLLRESE